MLLREAGTGREQKRPAVIKASYIGYNFIFLNDWIRGVRINALASSAFFIRDKRFGNISNLLNLT